MKYPYQGSYDLIKNRDSSGIDGFDVVAVLSEGRSQRSLAKNKDFFDLDLMNSNQIPAKWQSILNIFAPAIDVIRYKSWGCNPKR